MVNCTVTCGDMLLYNIKSHETHINSSFINKMTITNTLCTHPFFRWHVSAASANDSVVLFMMSTGNFSIVDLALLLNSLYVLSTGSKSGERGDIPNISQLIDATDTYAAFEFCRGSPSCKNLSVGFMALQ